MWPKATLLLVWPRNGKILDTQYPPTPHAPTHTIPLIQKCPLESFSFVPYYTIYGSISCSQKDQTRFPSAFWDSKIPDAEKLFGFIYFLFLFILWQLSQFPPPPPWPSSAQPTPCSHSPSPHRCPCPRVIHTCTLTNPSPFFPPFLPSPLSSGSCQSVPCFHVSGFVLLVSLFCSLDSSYKWDHMVFIFHQLAYFTEHNSL